MRHLLTLAAALAVGGFLASTAAQADTLFYPGGPVKQGTMCQFNTDMSGDQKYGFWGPCPAPARAARAEARNALDYAPARTGAFYAGGPVKQGTMCQFNTDMSGDQKYGYWGPCR
jgi:hypothetical protein